MRKQLVVLFPAALLAACGGGSGGGGGGAPPNTSSAPQEIVSEPTTAPAEQTQANNTSFATVTEPVSLRAAMAAESATTGSLSMAVPRDEVKVTVSPAGNGYNVLAFNVDLDDIHFHREFDEAKDYQGTLAISDQFGVMAKDGATLISYEPTTAADRLSYTKFGSWVDQGFGTDPGSVGMFATGFETPVADIPNSGTATYAGKTFGFLTVQDASYGVTGRATLAADFAKQSVTGTFDQMTAADLSASNAAAGQTWNNFTATAAISGAGFTGTTATTSASAISPDPMKGDIAGSFFGPKAAEVGGVWTLQGGDSFASGSFGAKQ
jgi:hypothetical protein